MGPEDIINLDSSSDEEEIRLVKKKNKMEDNNNNESPEVREEGEIEEGDDPNVEDMDLGDDVVVSKHSVLHASSQLVTNGPSSSGINAFASVVSADRTPISGVKRARVEYTVNEPSVRVIFNSLTRESKRKLMDLMQQWSKWEANNRSSSSFSKLNKAPLESGEGIYYAASHVGSEKSPTLSFWVDNQARTDNLKDEVSVPLYDREFTLGSSSADGSTNFEKADKEEPRCFNCGSYSHAIKECSKPRDFAAISNARKLHFAKKTSSNPTQGQNRYYQRKPGKYDDLKPGVLGPETRECLGIKEFDPPPWLHRMREIGYPPSYLEVVEDEDKPSGITIFTDKEEKYENNNNKKDDYEDGELPDEPSPPKTKMAVEFPGINAPIPEKADPFLWSSNPVRSAAPIYSSRYDPFDQPNMSTSSSRSLNLNRSSSDRWTHESASSYSFHFGTSSPDISLYQRERENDRDRERERERDRDRDRERDKDRYDHRRHHHRR